jgi:hypothetical protein
LDQLFLFSVASPKGLAKFIDVIAQQGGMSYSNNFDVVFQFNKTDHEEIRARFKKFGLDFGGLGTNASDSDEEASGSSASDVLKMFCEEAQLPNIQAATGNLTGVRLGEGQINYATSKLYTDFQLGWMCDANMTPLKFLNCWHSFIFNEYDANNNDVLTETGDYNKTGVKLSTLKKETGTLGSRDKSIRLKYPDQYQCNITITKTEKGKSAANSRGSMMYTLIDCFPYAIDAVPLSYGASQVTKVTANFYYSKYSIVYNDIRKFAG